MVFKDFYRNYEVLWSNDCDALQHVCLLMYVFTLVLNSPANQKASH